jgi:hypothetical protein
MDCGRTIPLRRTVSFEWSASTKCVASPRAMEGNHRLLPSYASTKWRMEYGDTKRRKDIIRKHYREALSGSTIGKPLDAPLASRRGTIGRSRRRGAS